LGEFILLA